MIQLWSSLNHISFADTFNRFGSPGIKTTATHMISQYLSRNRLVLETSTLFSVLKKCPNLRSLDLKHATNFLDIKALEIIGKNCLFFCATLLEITSA